MELALALVAIILSVFALPISLYAIVIVKAQQLSTHRVEYVSAPRGSEVDSLTQKMAEAPSPYDNLAYSEDDFDMDKSGI